MTEIPPGIWTQRFEFFTRYGLPANSPEGRAALRALPFGTRLRINSNFPAFLFGPFYFFFKGMWRKATTLLGAAMAAGAVLESANITSGLATGVATSIGAAAMLSANYAYYLHVTRHSRSWNPFEGFGRARGR